jgi:aspartyl-tRNA(Asn)/glutamyl-tRNA(Gln) amidotransferase subunit C
LSLHRDEMEALARLAHLHLPAEGTERLAHQLDDVLRWLAGLQAVDVEGVPEWSLDAVQSVALREDVPGVVLARDEVLAGVPEADDGQVVVPSFRGAPEE